MNKIFKNFKKKAVAMSLTLMISLSTVGLAFADSAKVVTLGANLSPAQKEQMLEYFGVDKNQAVILEVNNAEERKYLQGVASEEQLGKITISCSYVEPTSKGNGINVKTANLTWVTSAMIATTLSTAGIENANVIVAAPFPVSGTGGLTGVMKAFEDATGEELAEDKKELATEELITTGDLGDDIGQEKATGVINDIKTEIIKNGTSDVTQIADTINNVTNNYNITLSPDQFKQIEALMLRIADQKYDYNKIKDTLSNVADNVSKELDAMGEGPKGSFFEGISDFFKGIGDWVSGLFSSDKDLGILESTNDKLLGDDAQINATDDKAINLPSSEEVEGFFAKVWNWFTGLFDNGSNENKDDSSTVNSNENNQSTNEENTAGDSSLNEDTPSTEEGTSVGDENNNSNNEEQASQDEATSDIPAAQ